MKILRTFCDVAAADSRNPREIDGYVRYPREENPRVQTAAAERASHGPPLQRN